MTSLNARRLLAGAAALAAAGSLSAQICHWSGAVDACWTNAANWVENAVPGRYCGPDGEVTGAAGDIAVFDGATLSGNAATTVSFDGVHSVSNLLTTGAARFTYGTAADQYVPIEGGGLFSAAETAETPVATLACRLRLGVDWALSGWGNGRIYVRNNSAEELVVGEWGYTTRAEGATGSEPWVFFEGSGPVRIAKSPTAGAGAYRLDLPTTGTFTVDAELVVRMLSPDTAVSTAPLNVVITKNGSIKGSTSGVINAWRAIVFSGEGTYYFTYKTTVDQDSICAPVTFRCPVASRLVGAAPSADFTTRLSLYGYNGDSPLTFAGGSTVKGTVRLRPYPYSGGQYAVVAADAFGMSGTFGDAGDVDFEIVQGALRHTGAAADATDRAIAVTNRTTTAAGYAILEQSGAGAWTVTSPVTLLGDSTAAELRLSGAGTGAAAFRGTLADGISLVKNGTGAWTFAPEAGYSGAVTLNGGTLVLEDASPSAVTVSSASTLAVAAGKSVTVAALTIADGATLDVVTLDASATLKLPNATAVPAGLTFNGHAAVLEDGELKTDLTGAAVWKTAADGLWSDGANWLSGAAPDAATPVFVDANGADYAVTLDATAGESVTLTNLTVRNAGAGTATVNVKGVSVTLRGAATSDAPLLAIGPGGAVDATDATLALEKSSGSGPLLRMQGGSLALRGTAKLRHANGSVVFGTGSTAFYDEATFGNLLADTASGWQISPTRAGETAEVSFLGNSRTAFTVKPWECYLTGNGGVARLTVDSGHSAWMYNNFSIAQIGRESGVGEFLLKRGKFQMGNWNYVYVGMPSEGNAATGRVEVAAGASLYVYGDIPVESDYRGVQIGRTMSLAKENAATCAYGELRIDGTYEQRSGAFLVAAGPRSEADVFQAGTAKVNVAASRIGGCVGEVAIGAFGGRGRYTMTGGSFETGLNVYVGGALTNDLGGAHGNALLATRHGAQGTLAVSGGTFATTNRVIVGRDGTGVVNLSGTGVIKAKELVVSNTVGQAASELRFTADANGKFGGIDAATKLTFLPGARVVVDVTALASSAKLRSATLWSLDEAPAGLDGATVELVGADALAEESGLELVSGGRRFRWRVNRGAVLIVR